MLKVKLCNREFMFTNYTKHELICIKDDPQKNCWTIPFFSFQNDMRLVWKCRWNETFTRTLRITENIEKRRRKQTLCCMLYFEGVKGKVKIK